MKTPKLKMNMSILTACFAPVTGCTTNAESNPVGYRDRKPTEEQKKALENIESEVRKHVKKLTQKPTESTSASEDSYDEAIDMFLEMEADSQFTEEYSYSEDTENHDDETFRNESDITDETSNVRRNSKSRKKKSHNTFESDENSDQSNAQPDIVPKVSSVRSRFNYMRSHKNIAAKYRAAKNTPSTDSNTSQEDPPNDHSNHTSVSLKADPLSKDLIPVKTHKNMMTALENSNSASSSMIPIITKNSPSNHNNKSQSRNNLAKQILRRRTASEASQRAAIDP